MTIQVTYRNTEGQTLCVPYVAQSFLLAGSIFGLDQNIRVIKKHDSSSV